MGVCIILYMHPPTCMGMCVCSVLDDGQDQHTNNQDLNGKGSFPHVLFCIFCSCFKLMFVCSVYYK